MLSVAKTFIVTLYHITVETMAHFKSGTILKITVLQAVTRHAHED